MAILFFLFYFKKYFKLFNMKYIIFFSGDGDDDGVGASAAVRRRDLTLASGQGGEGEEGEKCPLVPVHQGSKCSE